VEASGYLVMISKILKSVNQVVETMMNRKLNVLVHCSDGWDRTAQMCALAQQCIDPYFRTIEGFCTLISKDWISFGHQFHLRFGQMDRNYKEEQRSPVFIQYLDCVRHLMI
jgi:myotubularin-related protein 1/2